MLIKRIKDKLKNLRPAIEIHGDDAYYVLSGMENMDMDDIMHLMQFTKLGKDRSRMQVRRSMMKSVCFGIFSMRDDRQIGFARAISDHATCYYLTDVVIDPEYRGTGAGEQLVRTLSESDELKDLRGVLLTKDAMPLYRKVGFTDYSGQFMERLPEAAAEESGENAALPVPEADTMI
ncbi:MAG: GNAT family N-acetyltransferase [Anaerovoracaceae bacterium]|nr:GNAT family N-acetyltransferase [Anaerovoracaceae bacterium]